MFEASEHKLESAALRMAFFLAPWDEETVGAPVATISRIEVGDLTQAEAEYQSFRHWCDGHRISLVNCKVAHDRLVESAFLESQGFRFIELNYRPELSNLAGADLGTPDDIVITPALPTDQGTMEAIAGQIFEAGRFHNDPMINPVIGARRYRTWISNAFRNPRQTVIKCLMNDEIVAFFVIENEHPSRCFWSLVGLAPSFGGRGMGARVWRAMLRWHQRAGVEHVSTSISSLNTPVHNLYVKLGFRFPPPVITLHWCPRGRVLGRET